MRTYKNMRPVDSVRLGACFETLSSFPNLSQRSNKSISRCGKGSGVVNASAFIRLLSKAVKLFFHIFLRPPTEYPHRIHRVFPVATRALRGEPRLASEARYLLSS